MTKKQLNGLVDCLVNVCTLNTTNAFSLSIDEPGYVAYYNTTLVVFTNDPRGVFCSSDIALLLSLANAWNVSLYFETDCGVTVAKFL